jgi:DNA polymerase-3 subunit delta
MTVITEGHKVVSILHGNDTVAIQESLSRLGTAMGDPGTVEMNTTHLDLRQASPDDFYQAVMALPFFGASRMVIVAHPFARLNSEAARLSFLRVLENIPETTHLILLVEDQIMRNDWETLNQKHWLIQWLANHPDRAELKAFLLPALKAMPEWIRKHALASGGQFTPQAAVELMGVTGNDTLAASQEIEKLLTYVDRKRPVEPDDVQILTNPVEMKDVFAMVDALSTGDAHTALHVLHGLFEQQDGDRLFGLVVRQIRLLLQAREVVSEGKSIDVMLAEIKDLNRSRFVAEKIAGQTRRFSLDKLRAAYHRLLALDEAVKLSQINPELALETFVVEFNQ